MNPESIIQEAYRAFRAAALAQWEHDGRRDIGTCGNAILILDSRSKVARHLWKSGKTFKTEGGITPHFELPREIRSQNCDITQNAWTAARDVFKRHGVRVAKFWTYID